MKHFLLLTLIFFCSLSIFSLDVQRDIVQKSRQYIGSTYSTGGTQPREFDCSGFVGFIMRPFVPNLPRLSKDMADSGKKITKEELSPGDLVFFATTSVPGAVSHVALYIGQDSIIHAISDGPDRGVHITSLSSRYWKEHYHSAVRVLQPAAQGVPDTQSAQTKGKADVTEKPILFAKGIYTGELRNNEPDGKGTLKLNNGDVYTGVFVKGNIDGKGTYIWADGSEYEGDFKDNALHGKGLLTDIDGSKRNVVYDNGKLVPSTGTKAEPAITKIAPKETYIQKADSPWDTWSGYVSGDYDQWKAKQQKDFEKFKDAYNKDQEQNDYEEWKKAGGN